MIDEVAYAKAFPDTSVVGDAVIRGIIKSYEDAKEKPSTGNVREILTPVREALEHYATQPDFYRNGYDIPINDQGRAKQALTLLNSYMDAKPVSLEKCAKAVFDEYYPHGYGYGKVPSYEASEDSHKHNLRRNAKAVLDAAGVKYDV